MVTTLTMLTTLDYTTQVRKARQESERARRELATARRELIQLRTDNEQLHSALVGSLEPLEAAKVVAFRRMQAALDADAAVLTDQRRVSAHSAETSALLQQVRADLAGLEGDVQRAVGNIEQQQRMLQSAAVNAACRVPMVVPPAMLSGMGGGSRGTHSTKTNPDPTPNPDPNPKPNPDSSPDPDPDSSQAAHPPQRRAQS